ncbi:MAG: anthranilate phosphoribosyltransferase [Anaerotignum propionicum]|uniref:anthranilate phosphoribosyltransferase n=1 Tax=Anaerotignum propionicum TaxID=28446 RepID=UPI002B1EA250|nr:anthranilate phosphoribosyltransferase [Anaerotignum propionicum]MEA5056959.1 anthranilate phosphoribosyltransferase [Anaerotignum propionicum]
MIKKAMKLAMEKHNISTEMAEEVMNEIMSGSASETEMAAYLTALRMKGETIDEITASAKGMRKACTRLLHDKDVLEIVGTGGDEAFTFNISTISAFVISAAGVPVAKHGNRSVSSKCGAADVLESLGVNIAAETDVMTKCLEENNICFMYAQKYHPSMKFVAPVRKSLGVRTIFNILGPLANPAGANMELMGVYDKELVRPLAQVMLNLGVKAGMVVCGDDGLDEITMTTTTTACEIRNGKLKNRVIDPEDYGFTYCQPSELVGGDPEENKKIALDILSGKEQGAKRDVVLLNAGVSLYIAEKCHTIQEGIQIAKEMLESGKAKEKLEAFIQATNR